MKTLKVKPCPRCGNKKIKPYVIDMTPTNFSGEDRDSDLEFFAVGAGCSKCNYHNWRVLPFREVHMVGKSAERLAYQIWNS